MQYHPQTSHTPAKITVAMTPMIDVVFLLLIFFLCTASFQIPEEDLAATLLVREDRPGATTTALNLPELDEVYLEGRVQANTTQWFVNEGPTPYAGEALRGLLSSLAEVDLGLPVTIEPRDEVPLGEVVDAYDAARLAGFERVQLVANAVSKEPAEVTP